MDKKGELAKNTLIILIGKICTQFISFFLLPLYTSVLVSSEFGIVDLVTTYIGLLVPIITLQLESALFRFLIDERNNENNKSKIISNVFIVVTILTTISIMIFMIMSNFIKIDYKYHLCIILIPTIFLGILLQTARGLGDNIGYSLSSVISGVCTVIFNIVFLVIFSLGPSGMFFSIGLANFLAAIFLAIRLRVYRYIKYKYMDKGLIIELLKYSMPLIPNGIIWWVINVSDRTLINIFLGNSANGIYAISNKFSMVFITVYNIFNVSWTESASLYIDTADEDKFFTSTVTDIFKMFSAMCLCIIAYMPVFFPIIINKQYSEAYNYIPILMIASLFNVLVGLISVVYVAKKLTKEIAKTSLIAGLINIIINFIMIKYIGLYAASLSTLISFMIMALYRYIDVKKYVNIKFKKSLVLQLILMFMVNIIIYYKDNLFLNIINIISITIFCVLLNKELILKLFKLMVKRLNNK